MRTVLVWIWRSHVWIVVTLFVLVIAIKAVVLPYLLEPGARQVLAGLSAGLTEQLGREVDIGFSSLEVSLGTRQAFVVVTDPYMSIGEQTSRARRARLVFSYQQQPVLAVDNAKIAVVRNADGTHAIGGITSSQLQHALRELVPQLLRSLPTSEVQLPIPDLFIATHAYVSYALDAESDPVLLPGTNFALRTADDGALQLSFKSLGGAPWAYEGRFDLKRGGEAADQLDFYADISKAGPLLRHLDLPQEAEELSIRIWGDVERSTHINIYARAQAPAVSYASADAPLAMTVSVGLSSMEMSARVADAFEPTRQVDGQWRLDTNAMQLLLPTTFLDGQLDLARVESSGGFRWNADSWNLRADDTRLTGPVGVGRFELDLAQGTEGLLAVNLVGGAPEGDFATIINLLPRSLSEDGVTYLRERLRAGRANMQTIVVAGADARGFPWPDGGGRFTIGVNVYDAELDYADGYPSLTDAAAKFGIEGTRFALTIVEGKTADARLSAALVGIDDLDADLITIYVALDAMLPNDGLGKVLLQLPPTRAKAEELLEVIQPFGTQRLLLTVAVPVTEGEPSVVGAVEMGDGSAAVYKPATLTASGLGGRLTIRDGGVSGLLGGKVLGSNVVLSLALADDRERLRLRGFYDLRQALADLGQPTALELQGTSAVTASYVDGDFSLASGMQGTSLRLPAPFGKDAASERPLRISVGPDATMLDYDNGLLRARLPQAGGAALAFGPDGEVPAAPATGTRIRGEVADIDIDALLSAGGDEDALAPHYPLDIAVSLPRARLLKFEHANLDVRATMAATLTTAYLTSEILDGAARIGPGGTVLISMARLSVPAPAEEPGKEIAAGTPTPALPALDARIDVFEYKDKTYRDIRLLLEPRDGSWMEASAAWRLASTSFSVAGGTDTVHPYTSLTVDIVVPQLQEFVSRQLDSDSVTEGAGQVTGLLSWRDDLFSPHYPSLRGTLDFTAEDIIITRGSGGVRLLNLLSPFTLLNTLSDLDLEGTRFDSANGQFAFADGLLLINQLEMEGDEVDISASGSTDIIAETNDIDYSVELAATDNLTAGAVSFVNPLAGAILLVFGNVLDAPLLGRPNFNYKVTGTWDEPEIITLTPGE